MQFSSYSISKYSKEYCQLQTDRIEKIGKNQVLVRNAYIGINSWDINAIRAYKNSADNNTSPPAIGMAAVGEVVERGKNIKSLSRGSTVAYIAPRGNNFSAYSLVNYPNLFPISQEVSFKQAAAYLFNGYVGYCMLRKSFYLKPEHRVLLQGASGALGQILAVLANRFEASVIATVGSLEKTTLIDKIPLDAIFDRSGEDFENKIDSFTSGEGINLAIDNTGENNHSCMRLLAPFGLSILHAGKKLSQNKVDIELLRNKSGFLTVPNFAEYKLQAPEYAVCCLEIFEIIRSGLLDFNETKEYNFSELNKALEEKEGGKFNFGILKVNKN